MWAINAYFALTNDEHLVGKVTCNKTSDPDFSISIYIKKKSDGTEQEIKVWLEMYGSSIYFDCYRLR